MPLFHKWFSDFRGIREPRPQTKLFPNEPTKEVTPHPAPVILDTSITRRYLKFLDPRTGHAFLGHPVIFLPGNHQQNVIEPGSHDALGSPGIWANDSGASGEISWVDDPQSGLFCRKIYRLNEVVGCKGTIEGAPYEFKDILQVGRNVVVYQLTNLKTRSYAVVGLGRDEFDVLQVLTGYLQRVTDCDLQYSSSEVISISDRVLEAFPYEETALFNKGAAMMLEGNFRQSHTCFELLIERNPDDQLAILHDATALANITEDNLAMKQFIRADVISEENFRAVLKGIPSIANSFRSLIMKLLSSNPKSEDAQCLWDKYFQPEESLDSQTT